jgi:cytochrome c oxidase subunit 4
MIDQQAGWKDESVRDELLLEEEHHPGPREYVIIAAILSVLTAIEVSVLYIEPLRDAHYLLVGLLLALMAVKFVLVVGWYMHLRFDHRYYTYIFAGGLVTATSIIIALSALFGYIV